MTSLDSLKEIKDFLIDIANGSSISTAMRMTDSYVYLGEHVNNIEKELKNYEWLKSIIDIDSLIDFLHKTKKN